MINIANYFKIANEINGKVASYLLDEFDTKKVMTHKKGSHYGINEDKISNEMYESFLKQHSPEVALYTEEGERNLNNDLVWVIDPIEGTSNYRSGNPFWATQIGLLYKNEVVLGIVNAPFLRQMFWAKKGKGAFLNDRKITVTDLSEFSHALIDMGRGTKDSDKDWFSDTHKVISKKLRTVRSFGACGLGISYTAAGIIDIYINSGSQIYDFAPASLIAYEAGGSVLNFEGKSWKVGDVGIVISNETLVRELIRNIV